MMLLRAVLLATVVAAAAAGGARAEAPADAVPAPAVSVAELPLSPRDGAAIAAASREAALDGLVQTDLSTPLAALNAPDETLRRQGELVLSAAAVALAHVQRGQALSPRAIDREWALATPYDARAAFEAARQSGAVAAWAAGLRPTQPGYETLAAARRRYAEIVRLGGWGAVGAGPPLSADAVDPRVALLRARLAAEGYAVAPSETPTVFDAALVEALKQFQTRRSLKVSGALDKATQTALDIPAEAILAEIDLNLERERWLPPQLPADRIEIDIAAQKAAVFQGQAPALQMRVIVGAPRRRTPSFASAVTSVLFNPPWVVPGSIASAELYPKERRSPGYLARNGFRQIGGQLVQTPGPRAALGYVKFEMDSPFGVYLHDTPSRGLFARDVRTLSHGCMRLEAPRELAALLLAAAGWSRADVDAAIAAGATRRVRLNAPVPVFIVYRTAVADASGLIEIRPDVYGWDARLTAALAGRRAAVAAGAKVE